MYEKSLSMYTGIEQLSKYFPLLEKQLQISKGRKLNDPHGEKVEGGRQCRQESATPRQIEI